MSGGMPTRSIPHGRRGCVAGFIAVLALLAGAPAQALVSCTTAATGVSFGVYDPLNGAPTVANGTLSVTCNLLGGGTTLVPVAVSLSTGTSGSYATRRLQSGSYGLGYNLYWSTAYTQVWGDGTGGSFYGTATLGLTPASPTQTVSGILYGRINAGQDVGPGSYLDTIVITVSY
jgi:spore coat protein U-like protein